MAKLTFKYSSVNSGKSIDLIRTAHNYEINGYNVLIIKPCKDPSDGNKISSSIGFSRDANIILFEDQSVIDAISGLIDNIGCIFIDDAHFLEPSHVDELFCISKACNIPVICYGLRNNFKMESFPGSERLLVVADSIEEIKTLCKCGATARYVARIENGKYVTEGQDIVTDRNSGINHEPVCADCYLQKVKKMDYKVIKKSLYI